jgi:hypothetical protein
MDVFFLFPGRVWIGFCLSLRFQQTKNPTGQKSFVCFGTFRPDTEFALRVSILFLNVFHRGGSVGELSVVWFDPRCKDRLALPKGEGEGCSMRLVRLRKLQPLTSVLCPSKGRGGTTAVELTANENYLTRRKP